VVLQCKDHDLKRVVVTQIGSSTKELDIVIIIMKKFDGNSWTTIKFNWVEIEQQ
jgi:hypothetical protein